MSFSSVESSSGEAQHEVPRNDDEISSCRFPAVDPFGVIVYVQIETTRKLGPNLVKRQAMCIQTRQDLLVLAFDR